LAPEPVVYVKRLFIDPAEQPAEQLPGLLLVVNNLEMLWPAMRTLIISTY
jgi:hypothetical protein